MKKIRWGYLCNKRLYTKKLLFYSSQFQNIFSYSDSYGWSTRGIKYDFLKMIKNKKRDYKIRKNI